jgi:hypothetical protein
MKFKDYIAEAASFNSGALSQTQKPGMFAATLGNDLYNLYNKISSRSEMAPDNLKPTFNGILNHIKLAYNLIRNQYPHFFKKID